MGILNNRVVQVILACLFVIALLWICGFHLDFKAGSSGLVFAITKG